jgi:hypothetical protein
VTETRLDVEDEILGTTIRISTGSGDKGSVKHIHEDENPESMCGLSRVPQNMDGTGNGNALHPFHGLDMYPESKWCQPCRQRFERKYLSPREQV